MSSKRKKQVKCSMDTGEELSSIKKFNGLVKMMQL